MQPSDLVSENIEAENRETEEQETGEQETGEQETGEQETGEQETGEQETGEQETEEQEVKDGNQEAEDENQKAKERIKKRIEYLKNLPKQIQNTAEWYDARYNILNASSAYKAIGSQALKNSLIYEKCQPKKQPDLGGTGKSTNINSTLHWGHKYEPLSQNWYKYTYNTKIDEFGCIIHDEHRYIGASPDGINTDESSDRFGRLLEIKNIKNREITGEPKKEYAIQMQIQMEVCDLDQCDFLETRFIEFEDANRFYESLEKKTDEPWRYGAIIHMYNSITCEPVYLYMPFELERTRESIEKWLLEEREAAEADPNYSWLTNNYWYLDEVSCILVHRDRNWFKQNLSAFTDIWDTIVRERVTGYQHRAPTRRKKVATKEVAIEAKCRLVWSVNKEEEDK